MTDLQALKQSLIDICREHSKAKEILKQVNGKRDYAEIAASLKIHRTTCSNILSKAKTFGLLEKENGYYKKSKEFKHLNVDRVLKESLSSSPNEKSLKLRKQRKVIRTDDVKKKLHVYFLHHFRAIPHPFSPQINRDFQDSELRLASAKLLEYLEKKISVEQLNGLSLRFLESFATFMSADRIRKIELINAFSNMVKCFGECPRKCVSCFPHSIRSSKRITS